MSWSMMTKNCNASEKDKNISLGFYSKITPNRVTLNNMFKWYKYISKTLLISSYKLQATAGIPLSDPVTWDAKKPQLYEPRFVNA